MHRLVLVAKHRHLHGWYQAFHAPFHREEYVGRGIQIGVSARLRGNCRLWCRVVPSAGGLSIEGICPYCLRLDKEVRDID